MKRNTVIALLVPAFLTPGLSLTAQTTVRTSSPNAVIPDSTCTGNDGSGGLTDAITIFNTTISIADVKVRVEIDHTFRSDLQFHVDFTGGGGPVILATDHGSLNNDYYATFDDAAATPCTTACSGGKCAAGNAPGPTCSPEGSLAAFNGLITPNTFTFAVCDDAGADIGTWVLWEISVAGAGLPVELQRFDVQ